MMAHDVELTIEPGSSSSRYWRDIWQYRELFYFLAWRDILVRYKQTAIGIAWSLLRPFATMLAFTLVFGRFAKLPSDGIPYPILVYAALLPWQFFASGLTESGNSLIDNSNLLTKVYFPRLIVPATSICVSLIDFGISFVILIAMVLWYGILPGWQIACIPFLLAHAAAAAFGAGLWISAMNVKYRDFRYVVPFIVQFGLYISPVGFSSTIVPDSWRFLYSLNPMVGVIEGFRWAITGREACVYWPGYLLSITLVGLLLYGGIVFFRKMERSFADVI